MDEGNVLFCNCGVLVMRRVQRVLSHKQHGDLLQNLHLHKGQICHNGLRDWEDWKKRYRNPHGKELKRTEGSNAESR